MVIFAKENLKYEIYLDLFLQIYETDGDRFLLLRILVIIATTKSVENKISISICEKKKTTCQSPLLVYFSLSYIYGHKNVYEPETITISKPIIFN